MRFYLIFIFAALLKAQLTQIPPAAGGGGGGSLPAQGGNAGKLLRTDGANAAWSFVLTGPTGGLDCSTGPCDLVTAVVPLLSTANTYTGANDYSGASSLTTVRGAGDPSTGCSVAGDVGKVYTRSDGAANNNLWVCENNGGTRRWIQPSSAGATFSTTDQGFFPFGYPGANDVMLALTQWRPRYFGLQVYAAQTINEVTWWAATGAAGNIRIGIYDSSCNLLGQTGTTANTGLAVGTFSAPVSAAAGYYYIAVVSDHATGGVIRPAGTQSTLEALMMNTGATTSQLFNGPDAGTITLPASCGTRTSLTGYSNYIPSLYLRP